MGRGARKAGGELRRVERTEAEKEELRHLRETTITLFGEEYRVMRFPGNRFTDQEFVELQALAKAFKPVNTSLWDKSSLMETLGKSATRSSAWMAEATSRLGMVELCRLWDERQAHNRNLFDLTENHRFEEMEEEEQVRLLNYRTEVAMSSGIVKARLDERDAWLEENWDQELPAEEQRRELLYQILSLTDKESESAAHQALNGTIRLKFKNFEKIETDDLNRLLEYQVFAIGIGEDEEDLANQLEVEKRLEENRKLAAFGDRSPTTLVFSSPDNSSWNKMLGKSKNTFGFCGSPLEDDNFVFIDSEATENLISEGHSAVLVHELIHSIQPGKRGYKGDLDKYLLEGLTELTTQEKIKGMGLKPKRVYTEEQIIVKEIVSAIAHRERKDFHTLLEDLNTMDRVDRNDALMSVFSGDSIEEKTANFSSMFSESGKEAELLAEERGGISVIGDEEKFSIFQEVCLKAATKYFEQWRKQEQLF